MSVDSIDAGARKTRFLIKVWLGVTLAMALIERLYSEGLPGVRMWWFWAVVFGVSALRQDGLLTQPSGHRKVAWIMGMFTAVGLFSLWLGLTQPPEPTTPGYLSRTQVNFIILGFVAFSVHLLVHFIRRARQNREPPIFAVWPPCRPERRRSASLAALAFAAVCLVFALLVFLAVIPVAGKQHHSAIGMGVFYGVATLIAGLQMWHGRLVAATVGVLVPVCLILTMVLPSLAIAKLVPPLFAGLGAAGAITCAVFLIRGVTCRPAI